MWLSNQSKPDIANVIRAVAKYCHATTAVHWKTALQILQHVRGKCGLGTIFQKGKGLQFGVFADEDYAS